LLFPGRKERISTSAEVDQRYTALEPCRLLKKAGENFQKASPLSGFVLIKFDFRRAPRGENLPQLFIFHYSSFIIH